MLLLLATAHAASPLTDVRFAEAYADVDLAPAQQADTLVAALRSDLRFDKKLALATAWPGREGTARKLVEAIAADKKLLVERLRLEDLSGEERALVAFLRAREDDTDLSAIDYGADGVLGIDPLGLARSAAKIRPDDFSVVVVSVLVATADPTVGAGCNGWTLWEQTLHKHPEAGRNLRPPAVDAVEAAIRARCPTPTGAPAASARGGGR
ncbi:MAG: hypothetical protein R3F59_08725 [Myxococcota bacterium]